MPTDGTTDHDTWLAQVNEAPLEPQLPICDAHHHLWLDLGHTGWPYTLDDLHADTGRGTTWSTPCSSSAVPSTAPGPVELRPVGGRLRGRPRRPRPAPVAPDRRYHRPWRPDARRGGRGGPRGGRGGGGGRFRGAPPITADEASTASCSTARTTPGSWPWTYPAGLRTLASPAYTLRRVALPPPRSPSSPRWPGLPDVTIVTNHLWVPRRSGRMRAGAPRPGDLAHATWASLAGVPQRGAEGRRHGDRLRYALGQSGRSRLGGARRAWGARSATASTPSAPTAACSSRNFPVDKACSATPPVERLQAALRRLHPRGSATSSTTPRPRLPAPHRRRLEAVRGRC